MNKKLNYQLEAQVGHLLRRANQRHTALFAEMFNEYGLTALQFAALMKLREFKELSQNQLGRLTAMDPNTIQGVVKRLQQRGLVERHPHAADRRRVTLVLSQDGVETAARLVAVGLQISAQTLSPLTQAEQRQFLDLLERLA
jgi:MarR family transcriptional regulator, lower aerobic nicotinate degradation pathway regulator